MKICVFGADGRTGVEVVNYAVARGHDVVAFVYNNLSNTFFPGSVQVRMGNVLNQDVVREVVVGCDAVISVLGHIKGSDPLMQTKGITNIVHAMQDAGVVRIISLTGTGAREAGDTPSFVDRFLNIGVKFVDPNRINDGVEHVKVLKQSNLNWTIVRVLKLSKSETPAETYELSMGGPAELLTSRKKVAKVLVDVIDDSKYFGKLPVVSG